MLVVPFFLAFAVQPPVPAPASSKRDTTTFVRDSANADSVNQQGPRRFAVTPNMLASAFRDERARDLYYRARAARMAQDSSLRDYAASVRTRVTLGLRLGESGRERMVYRNETASRVRWKRDVGARVELTGARITSPIVSPKTERNEFLVNLVDHEFVTVPYFPGHEALWIGEQRARTEVDDRRLVNPLAEGAEAYYTYESGDSVRYTLPDRRVVHLRELRVRPRSQAWNLAVGTLTFDIATGQLVQAAYRLAAPIDVWALAADRDTSGSGPAIVIGKTILSPYRNEISEVAIVYGLFEGRYWLPRSRTMRGTTQIAVARFPILVEHAYRYLSVNAGIPMAPIAPNMPNYRGLLSAPDSLRGEAARKWRDSVAKATGRARDAKRDSLDTAPCDSTGRRTLARERDDGQLAVAVTIPCDVDELIESPDFTEPIYAAGEDRFGSRDRDELVERALALGAQAPFDLLRLPAPQLQYGLSMTRYNRVEGLSTGIGIGQQLGGGYSLSAAIRLGVADLEPNGELAVARTNLRTTVTLAGYNRLASASDWGRPLSFGASVSGFLFGRDEGFYYRSSGAELRWNTDRGLRLDWRLFAERQRTARQETSFSVSGDFGPNVQATEGWSTGASVQWVGTFGLDPRGFRLFTDVRLEAARGDSSYGRGALDLTLSRGLPLGLSAALTLAGGSTVGALPVQRRWHLGGPHTVRGQRPDTAQSGNAFWLTRAEVGRDFRAVRASIFGDLGWAGDRERTSAVGRPLSGLGVGLSLLDGAVRLDVARGIHPRRGLRVDLTLGARW